MLNINYSVLLLFYKITVGTFVLYSKYKNKNNKKIEINQSLIYSLEFNIISMLMFKYQRINNFIYFIISF